MKYFSYEVKIVDESTVIGNRKFDKKAIIFFYDANRNILEVKEKGYINRENIYQMIYDNKDINIDNAYIENFSILEYKKLYNIQDEQVVIKNFSARESVFISQYEINFSDVIFSGKSVTFEKSVFLKGNIIFDKCLFEEGNVNFNGTLFFEGNISFYDANFVKGDTNFKNCYFGKGIKNFQYTFWGNSNVFFSNSFFDDGLISFVNSSFEKGEINFKICEFTNVDIDFHYSNFEDVFFNFEKIILKNGIIDFSKTEFGNCKFNFNKSQFGKCHINFEGSECKSGKINLKNADYKEGDVIFDICNFSNADVYFNKTYFDKVKISFYKSKFKEISFKTAYLNDYVDIRVKICQTLDLSETIIRDIVNIVDADNPHNIKSLYIYNARIMGQILIDWEINNIRQIILQQNTSYYEKAWQFNVLKKNFNIIGAYDDEDNAYVSFKQMMLKYKYSKIKNSPFFKKLYLFFSYLFELIVFDKMGKYATSPLKVFISVIFTWFIFGFIYYFINILDLGFTRSSVGNPDHLSTLTQSFYHSAITFFTIGYGDVYPCYWTRLFSGIEGFIGVFMMSYFTVAFVRKVLR